MEEGFASIEDELRAVETYFSSGRLSAFGSEHDAVAREMRKVSELEVQVFFRTCAQAKASAEEDTAVRRALGDQGLLHPAEEEHGPAPSDRSFEAMAKMFRAREAALKNVGGNLKQMSRHVTSANEALQRAHADR